MDGLTQRITSAIGLAERVDPICGKSDEFPRKPDPALLDHLPALCGIRREQALVVGDSLPDVEFARNSGAAFCGVLTGQATHEDFREVGVSWVVETLKDLCEQLEASGASAR